MEYVNCLAEMPPHVRHATFHSHLYGHALGYHIYLPADHETSNNRYPVLYHLHGWTGDESSDVWTLEALYKDKPCIAVFPNSSPVIRDREHLPVEDMLITELIPHIDRTCKTSPNREDRAISGFSMGGAMAFLCATKYPVLFGKVTAYAGTYHHFYHKGYHGVGEAPEKAVELYGAMMRDRRYMEEGNILHVVGENAEAIRGHLDITMLVGAEDVLFCDNEIMHRYLTSLGIPHRYHVMAGVDHVLPPLLHID